MIKAIIFDLDGVIVSTDECHYKAWRKMADEEGIYFDKIINDRLRGVSRAQSLEIILEKANKQYTETQKQRMCNNKNNYYKEFVKDINQNDILPGIKQFIKELKINSFAMAIGSSSKNAGLILKQVGLENCFDAVVDGNDIQNSKPAPDVFIKACEKLGMLPKNCLVIEDASSGVEAAAAAGIRTIGVGNAFYDSAATYKIKNLKGFSIEKMNSLLSGRNLY